MNFLEKWGQTKSLQGTGKRNPSSKVEHAHPH
jgi:hypothetical protein